MLKTRFAQMNGSWKANDIHAGGMLAVSKTSIVVWNQQYMLQDSEAMIQGTATSPGVDNTK